MNHNGFNIILSPATNLETPGSEVIVTAERQKFERTIESSQISLDLREINAAPAFIEPDVFRTLQMLPGVQTSSDLSSALYVRGSTPDQNLIMLDGIAIYNPFHLFGIFSYNCFQIVCIIVIK